MKAGNVFLFSTDSEARFCLQTSILFSSFLCLFTQSSLLFKEGSNDQDMMGPQSGTKEKTATKQSIKGKTKTWGFFFTPCPKKLPKLIQFYLIFIDLEKIFLVLDRKILLNIRMILNIHSFRKKKNVCTNLAEVRNGYTQTIW